MKILKKASISLILCIIALFAFLLSPNTTNAAIKRSAIITKLLTDSGRIYTADWQKEIGETEHREETVYGTSKNYAFKVTDAQFPGVRIITSAKVQNTGYFQEFDILEMDPATAKVNLSGMVDNIDNGATANIYISSIGIDPGVGTNYGSNGDGQSVWNAVNSTIEAGYRYRYYYRINPDDNTKVDLICYKKSLSEENAQFVENCVLYKLLDNNSKQHYGHVYFEGTITIDNYRLASHNGALDGATAEGVTAFETSFNEGVSNTIKNTEFRASGGEVIELVNEEVKTNKLFKVTDAPWPGYRIIACNTVEGGSGYFQEFDILEMDPATARINLSGMVNNIDNGATANIYITSLGIEPAAGTNYGANGDGQSVWNAVNSTIEAGYRYRYYFRVNPEDNTKVDLICYKKPLSDPNAVYSENCVLYKLLNNDNNAHYGHIYFEGTMAVDNYRLAMHNGALDGATAEGTTVQETAFDSISNSIGANLVYANGGELVVAKKALNGFKVTEAPWPGYRIIACNTVEGGSGYFQEFDVIEMDPSTAKVNLSGMVDNIDNGATANIYVSSIGIDPGVGTNYGSNGDGQSVWNAVNSTLEAGYRYRYYYRVNPDDNTKVDLICYKKSLSETNAQFVENCVLYKLLDNNDKAHYGHLYFEGTITIDNYRLASHNGALDGATAEGTTVQETAFDSISNSIGANLVYANGGEIYKYGEAEDKEVVVTKLGKVFKVSEAPWPGYRLFSTETLAGGAGYFQEFDIVEMDPATARINLSGMVDNIDNGATANIYITSLGIEPAAGTNYGANGDTQSVWNGVNSTIEAGYRYRYYYRVNPDDNTKVDLICYKKPLNDPKATYTENCVLYKLLDNNDKAHYGHLYFEGTIAIDNYRFASHNGALDGATAEGTTVQETDFEEGLKSESYYLFAAGGEVVTIEYNDPNKQTVIAADSEVIIKNNGKVFKVEKAVWPGYRIIACNKIPAGTGYFQEFDVIEMDPATAKVNLSGMVDNIDNGATANIYVSSLGIDLGVGTNYGANGDGQSVWNAVNSTIEAGYRYRYYYRVNPDDNTKVDLICYKKPLNDPEATYTENCVLYKLLDNNDKQHYGHIYFEGTMTIDNFRVATHSGALDGATAEGTTVQETTFDQNVNSVIADDTFYANGGKVVADTNVRFTALKDTDKLLSYYQINTNNSLEKVLELNASILVQSKNGKVGFAFGLSGKEDKYDSNGVSFVYFENEGSKTYAGIMKDGEIGERVELTKSLRNDFASIKVLGLNDGSLNLYVGDTKVATFADQHFDGYFAILTDGKVGTDFTLLPDFILDVYKLDSGTGTGVETNFNKGYIVDKFENDTHNAVSLGDNAHGVRIVDGVLKFDGTSDGTNFAVSDGTYADFILQFDWINYKWEDRPTNNGKVNFTDKPATGNNELYSPLGVSFGKSSPTSGWSEKYLLRFFDGYNLIQLIDNGVGYNTLMGTGFDTMEHVLDIQEGKINLYEQTINLKIVSRNSMIYVYGVKMNENGTPDGEHKLLAEYEIENPTGYISLSTSEAGYFGIDNFRLTNTDGWTDEQYEAYENFKEIADDPVEATKLEAPVTTLSGKTVSWSAVENAEGYDVYVDGEKVTTTTSLSYELTTTDEGEYEIYVVAKGNGTTTKDSDRSNKQTITISSQGGEPGTTTNENPTDNPTTDVKPGESTTKKKGCKSTIGITSLSIALLLPALSVLALRKKKEE